MTYYKYIFVYKIYILGETLQCLLSLQAKSNSLGLNQIKPQALQLLLKFSFF